MAWCELELYSLGAVLRIVYPNRTADWKKAVVTIDLDPQETTYLAEGGQEKTTTRKYKTSIEEFGFGF